MVAVGMNAFTPTVSRQETDNTADLTSLLHGVIIVYLQHLEAHSTNLNYLLASVVGRW